ncbi:MAG: hypothetical protein ACXABY_01335 [Candidatus Thorarchaeota archaeon]|jgi:hypothetical protein
MSANRWSVCPRCENLAKASATGLEGLFIARNEAYGKVSQEEYLGLCDALTEALEKKGALSTVTPLDDNLREDWELYRKEGKLILDYNASCQEAGCSFKFFVKEEWELPE